MFKIGQRVVYASEEGSAAGVVADLMDVNGHVEYVVDLDEPTYWTGRPVCRADQLTAEARA